MTRVVAVFVWVLAVAGCASRAVAPSPAVTASGGAHAGSEPRAGDALASGDPRLRQGALLAVDDSECRNVHADGDAVRLFQQGCDGGDARGCFDLSIRYLCGVGVPRDAKRGAEAAERSCQLGASEACGNAGMLFLQLGDGARANAVLTKGCAANDVASCNNLGTLYMSSGDGARAKEIFAKLCEHGNDISCANLGTILGLGLGGVPAEPVRGAALSRAACDKNNAVACNTLAALSFQGAGVPLDKARGVALFRRACDLGNAGACDNLAQCYAAGEGTTRDLGEAQALFTRACSGGHAHACTILGELKAAETFTPPVSSITHNY